MTPRRLEHVTLIDTLAERLEGQILSGELEDGTRLPSEEALGVEFGVSRPLVREALSRLRERGYLRTVNGSGTFVRYPSAEHVADALLRHLRLASNEGFSIDNLYEARTAIEVTSAQLAAQRGDQAAIARIEAHLDEMRARRTDPTEYTAADAGFHVEVAKSTENPFLTVLLTPLIKMIVQGIFKSHDTTEAVEAGIRAHTIILKQIKAGNPAAAGKAMARHLQESRASFVSQVIAQDGRIRDEGPGSSRVSKHAANDARLLGARTTSAKRSTESPSPSATAE